MKTTATTALALTLCLSAPAFAAETPTLDELHEANITMPESTEVYPESAYTLTKVDAPGASTITKYEWNEDKTQLVPVYYEISLKQTEYGSGDTSKYYKWDNTSGNYQFVETANPDEAQITAKYNTPNPDNFSQTITKSIDNGTIIDPPGTSPSSPYQFNSGAALNNPTGTTETINNILYKDNTVTGTLESTIFSIEHAEINGGAIYNAGKITEITGAFQNNGITATASATSGNANIYAYGGAIYNAENAEIGNITADFIGNYVSAAAASSSYADGGAIYNYNNATIGDITGDFIGNYASSSSSSSYADGGAIYNYDGTIGDITGDFIGNYVAASGRYASGGAIYNYDGTIGDITGDFIGNYVAASSSYNYGGAINNNDGTIGDITGDFIGNYASGSSGTNGGAIYNNDGTIGDITGDFIGNYASSSSYAYGGAIYNYGGEIGDITGDFIGNYASSTATNSYSKASGGAIYNSASGTIGDITGDFIGNYVSSASYDAEGGAIHNRGTIGSLTGDFIGNYASSSSSNVYGGAIYNYNYATIDNITGDFIGNYASSSSSNVYGGAIYNSGSGTIGDITGDFIGNYASSDASGAYGGAIYNVGTIGTTDGGIYGSFINNYATTTSDSHLALGGAVYTSKNMNFIADNQTTYFTGNYTQDPTQGKVNNAIFVVTSSSSARTIKLQAQNNGMIVFNDQIDGGSVSGTTIDRTNAYNLALTGDETGTIQINNDIINANITLENVNLHLGNENVFDRSKSFTIKSGGLSTVNKSSGTLSNVILEADSAVKLAIDADLNAETTDVIEISSANSGASIILEEINAMNEMQVGKDSFSTIFLTGAGAASVNTSLASELSTVYGQSYVYDVDLNGAELTFNRGDKIPGLPGAVADTGDRTFIMSADEIVTDWKAATQNDMQGSKLVVQGNGNSVLGENNAGVLVNNAQTIEINNVKTWENFSSASGGAINNTGGTTTITDSAFTNNTAGQNGGAIYNEAGVVNIIAANSTVKFENNTANGQSNAIHNVNATLNLNASGQNNIIFNDSITSDSASVININATQDDVQSVVQTAPTDGTIVINNDMSGYKGDVNFHHGTLKLGKDGMLFDAQNFNVYGCTLDLANGVVQAADFNNLNIASNSLELSIDADLAAEKIDTISAQNTITDSNKINVSQIHLLSDALNDKTVLNFTDDSLKSAVTYTGDDVAYSDIYKYAVDYDENDGNFTFSRYSPATTDGFNPAVIAGAVAQQAAFLTMLDVYDQAFANMDMYLVGKNAEKHALKLKNYLASAENTAYESSQNQAWFRPYASFENIALKNGPRVSNVQYGSLFGADSEIEHVKFGFDRVLSAYAGYVGSHQAFQGQSIYQNGGVLGASAFFYKNDFFAGLTANTAGIQAEATTIAGHDDMTMLAAGIAAKTGYNWGLFDEKLIIQPNAMMSYTFVNTFNYHTSAGVSMDSSPLHAIQLLPGVKIAANLQNGWQPYLRVAMVFNIMDDTKFQANEVSIPELSVKPYILYGAGVQKQWGERFTCFVQTLLRSGGRNGIGFSAGLKWKI